MAETGKKPDATRVAVVSPQNDPAPDVASHPSDVTPETPEESPNAGVVVRCQWPHTEFIVPDVAKITSDGTKVTKSQLADVRKAADSSGVTLIVEEGDN